MKKKILTNEKYLIINYPLIKNEFKGCQLQEHTLLLLWKISIPRNTPFLGRSILWVRQFHDAPRIDWYFLEIDRLNPILYKLKHIQSHYWPATCRKCTRKGGISIMDSEKKEQIEARLRDLLKEHQNVVINPEKKLFHANSGNVIRRRKGQPTKRIVWSNIERKKVIFQLFSQDISMLGVITG